MTPKKEKTFVLDTNVILHDSSCIYHFQENDKVIPITVLEELDQFKKGNSSLNYHAREFLRNLDSISGDLMFETGIGIGEGHGKIMIKLEREFHPDLKLNFSTQKADHHVLNICYHLNKDNPSRQVILVSKDVNLRMKAKAVNLTAQDYTSDHVKDVSALYEGLRVEDTYPQRPLIYCISRPLNLIYPPLHFHLVFYQMSFLYSRMAKRQPLACMTPPAIK
jgi:PhoH-like ATPase